jgi:hypothetical protein
MSDTDSLVYGFTGFCYAIGVAVALLAYWRSGKIELLPEREPPCAGRRPLSRATRFLWRIALTGVSLFLLPPFGADPPYWQIGLTLLAWVGLAYRYGLWSRGRWLWAVAEAAPAVGLSLIWTHLLVLVGELAVVV